MQRPMFVVMVRNNVGQLEFCGLRTTPIAADELAKQKTEGKPGWTYVVDRYDVRIPIPRLVVACCDQSDTEALYVDGQLTETHPQIHATDLIRLSGGSEHELIIRSVRLSEPGNFPTDLDELTESV